MIKLNTKDRTRFPHEELTAIVILDDGDAWSPINGVTITVVTNDQMKQLQDGTIGPHQLSGVLDIALDSSYFHCTPKAKKETKSNGSRNNKK